MTEINFLYCGKLLAGFEMSGHADDSQVEGEAVLCAALSSAAYLVANTITDILHVDADIEVDEGYMMLVAPEEELEHCADILNGLRLHFTSLAEDYSDNITLNDMEVQYNAED